MTKRFALLPVQNDPSRVEVGVDEVGRGCLAGPVVAAAVILPPDLQIPGLRDSKQLSAQRREILAEIIREQALAYGIGEASPVEIDSINILQATYLAMHRAISGLRIRPEYLLIDGNRYTPADEIPYQTVIKGDDTYLCIAAASVLAKVHRDHIMVDLHKDYPHYDWHHNVGYGTAAHIEGIHTHGLTPHHRRSFGPCRPSLFDSI